jgi:hypothetical protein
MVIMTNLQTTKEHTTMRNSNAASVIDFDTVSPAVSQARHESNQARLAEDKARNRRLDKDAIVKAALLRLFGSASEQSQSNVDFSRNAWLACYVQAITGRSIAVEDIRALLSEIENGLSPVVRS